VLEFIHALVETLDKYVWKRGAGGGERERERERKKMRQRDAVQSIRW
jgi:hypothetical protein